MRQRLDATIFRCASLLHAAQRAASSVSVGNGRDLRADRGTRFTERLPKFAPWK